MLDKTDDLYTNFVLKSYQRFEEVHYANPVHNITYIKIHMLLPNLNCNILCMKLSDFIYHMTDTFVTRIKKQVYFNHTLIRIFLLIGNLVPYLIWKSIS